MPHRATLKWAWEDLLRAADLLPNGDSPKPASVSLVRRFTQRQVSLKHADDTIGLCAQLINELSYGSAIAYRAEHAPAQPIPLRPRNSSGP
jgi:hypothetical protein